MGSVDKAELQTEINTLGLLRSVASNHGPVYESRVQGSLGQEAGEQLLFLRPCKSNQNTFIERFTLKLRQVCLHVQ
jgi:hypothetical protein